MLNLNYNAPLGSTGYGVAGLNFYLELKKLGVNVSLFPIGQDFQGNEAQVKSVREGLESAKEFDSWAPTLRIWHQFALAERIGRGKSFAMPIFELDTFTTQEKTHLSSVDELIVNSQWAADVIKDQTGLDAHVVPLGYNPDVFYPNPVPKNPGSTVFMNIGKWEVRKGHDILCKAFNDAFEPTDDVQLWMSNYNPFYTDEQNAEWANYYLSSKMGQAGKIRIIDWQKDQRGLAYYMRLVDVGVFPSRGEGWNLEALEMIACDKHVILSDYSAHTEFCRNGACATLPVNGVEPAQDGVWFNGQGNWAAFDEDFTDGLVQAMRDAHLSSKTEGDVFPALRKYRQEIADEYTWNKSAQKLKDVLYG